MGEGGKKPFPNILQLKEYPTHLGLGLFQNHCSNFCFDKDNLSMNGELKNY